MSQNVVSLGECSMRRGKKVYSALVGWSVLQLSVRFGWWIVLFTSSLSLLVFSIVTRSVTERRVLRSPLWICLFFLSVLSVFASRILKLCCLPHTHLKFLCLLGGMFLCVPGNLCSGVYYTNVVTPL